MVKSKIVKSTGREKNNVTDIDVTVSWMLLITPYYWCDTVYIGREGGLPLESAYDNLKVTFPPERM
jgi:hypothetical protein